MIRPAYFAILLCLTLSLTACPGNPPPPSPSQVIIDTYVSGICDQVLLSAPEKSVTGILTVYAEGQRREVGRFSFAAGGNPNTAVLAGRDSYLGLDAYRNGRLTLTFQCLKDGVSAPGLTYQGDAGEGLIHTVQIENDSSAPSGLRLNVVSRVFFNNY
ncbi:hypothetical protein [Deinococcus sp.]|uniref:hypothetical protein n=1 Tax=Deinococcus sp. TaxID=47478 RepID=UPI0025E07304|nr:hypothetical protein [Deinococcus sp.]